MYVCFSCLVGVVLLMKDYRMINPKGAFWSLNEDILTITILKTNTPYPSRKIRRKIFQALVPTPRNPQYAVSNPWIRRIALVAIIDRQLPFEYTIASRSTDVMVVVFERENLSGSNYNEWFRSPKMVLRVEKKLFVIEQSIYPASPTDSKYLCSGMQFKMLIMRMLILRSEKANKKSLNAKGKGKGKGKGKDKSNICKPKNPKPSAKGHPIKDDTCHHYKEVDHCKRNCHAYLAELIKKKKQVGTTSSSDIFIMAASAIVISSNSSDESVGSPPSRVILFGDIPTVIPSTSVVAPETSTIAPVISPAAPMVETTLVASPTGLGGLVPYTGSDSDSPDEMTSPEHISPLPAISPFICTDSSEAPDSSDYN
ncbi:hypothetical protein Tco_1080444 [Tanacetum coccineum]|uniref:Uncharacterized protein n=1 Tax=Tanacetum coccineum TaxID=301880 RepID=A0ABQ5HV00_9ASTR